AFFPFVVGRIWVEALAPDQVDIGPRLRSDISGHIHVVTIADVNDVRSHAAARRSGPAIPRPPILRYQRGTSRAVGVEFSVAANNRGRVVNLDLAIEGEDLAGGKENCGNE